MGIIGKHFTDVGGTADKLRRLAASLMSAGGNDQGGQAIQQQLQARQEDELQQQQAAQMQAYRDAQIQHMNQPEAVNLGNGGFGTFQNGQLNMIREPAAPQTPSSESERLIDRWKSLPDGSPEKALIERTLRGYQYTAPVMQAQQQNRMAVHQAPTYSNLHPHTPARAAPKPPAGFILD